MTLKSIHFLKMVDFENETSPGIFCLLGREEKNFFRDKLP